MKLDDSVLIISLPKSYSMNRLIGIGGWVDVTNDESISLYMPVTLSFLVPSIMIDESKSFN